MKKLMMLTAAFALSATIAGALTSGDVIADLTAQGYTRIEVKTGLTQIKVEAIKGTTKIETIYDLATGAILKSETGPVGAFDDTAPGVEVSVRDRDFIDGGSGDDDSNDDGDDEGESDDSGHDGDGDDDGDNSGDDDGDDDDGDDDHGGNSGSGNSGSDNSGSGSNDD